MCYSIARFFLFNQPGNQQTGLCADLLLNLHIPDSSQNEMDYKPDRAA